MNINAMMKQAEKMKKDMEKVQEDINSMSFEETCNNIVKVTLKGDKKVSKIELLDEIDDLDMVFDMVTIAINNCHEQIDAYSEKKLGKISQGLAGLF